MDFSWTDQKLESLKDLYSKGFSARQIAAEIGAPSRNAVCGKISRMGLVRDFHLSTKARRNEPRGLQRTSTPRPRKPQSIIREADITPLHLSLTQLTSTTCRYPYGDRDFTFCGCEAPPDKPYCPAHEAITCGRGTASERSATKVRLAA